MGKPYRAIKAMFPRNRWRIVEGDEVVVRGTQFAGQIGKVLAVLRDPRVPQVVVEGVNLRKKKVAFGDADDDQFVVTMEHPIHYSSVNLIEPATSSSAGSQGEGSQMVRGTWPGVRAKFRYDQNGERVRIGKGKYAAGRIIPWPTPVTDKPLQGGVKDTDAAEAALRTYTEDDFEALLEATGRSASDANASPSATHSGGAQQTGSGIGGGRPPQRARSIGTPLPPPRSLSYSTASCASHATLACLSPQQPQLRWATQHMLHGLAASRGGELRPWNLLPSCCYGSFAAQGESKHGSARQQ